MNGIGGFFRIANCAQGYRPEAIAMAAKNFAKCVGVSGHVQGHELAVVELIEFDHNCARISVLVPCHGSNSSVCVN